MIAANEILSFYTTAGRMLIEGGVHALTALITLFGLWLSLEG